MPFYHAYNPLDPDDSLVCEAEDEEQMRWFLLNDGREPSDQQIFITVEEVTPEHPAWEEEWMGEPVYHEVVMNIEVNCKVQATSDTEATDVILDRLNQAINPYGYYDIRYEHAVVGEG